MKGKPAGASSAVRWTTGAAKLAEALPRTRLHPAVVRWADTAGARTWGVAFSGGADSLALLLLLWAHWPAQRRRLRVLHFNHRLRGRESGADVAFCRKVCRALKVPLIADSWSDAVAGASEAEARVARLTFLDAHAKVVWFGHQQDDVAESMMMRLARGSGTSGLAAPRPVHRREAGRVRLRPLLTLKKSEIVAALRGAGVAWREDSSNAGRDYFRNRVRLDVLPAWVAAAGRDALAGAARSRELLEEDDAALESAVDRLAPMASDGSLNLRRLVGAPRALVRRALHRWLRQSAGSVRLSRQAFDALLDAVIAAKPTRQSMGHAFFAVVTSGRLRLRRNEKYEGIPRPA